MDTLRVFDLRSGTPLESFSDIHGLTAGYGLSRGQVEDVTRLSADRRSIDLYFPFEVGDPIRVVLDVSPALPRQAKARKSVAAATTQSKVKDPLAPCAPTPETRPLMTSREQQRSRRAHPTRSLTINVRHITKLDLAVARAIYPEEGHQRPRVRKECADVPRPCPYVSCRHHLFLDVKKNGSIKLNFPDLEVDELPETCVLDVADNGCTTLEGVGELLNMTRERVRQLQVAAFAKTRRRLELYKEPDCGD